MKVDIVEACVILREDGIVHVHYKDETEINVELQGRLTEIYNKICGDSKKPVLFTTGEHVTITKEAPNYSR